MQPATLLRFCGVPASSIGRCVKPFTLNQSLNALRSTSMLRSSSVCVLSVSSSPFVCRNRSFHSSSPIAASSSFNSDAAKSRANDWLQCAVQSVQTASKPKLQHWANVTLAAGIPLALFLSPSKLAIPFDLALGVALPFHIHVGMGAVIDDYVPRAYQSFAHFALIIFTAGLTIGALKINLCGPGIAESVKALWRSPKEKQKAEEKKAPAAVKK